MSNKPVIQSSTSPQTANLISVFLGHHTSGVLTTADAVATPHASVVYYKIDSDFVITFGTKTETQKYKNMQQNKQVSFLVYDEPTQTVAQVHGQVEEIEDESIRDEVIGNMVHASIESSGNELPPAEKLYAGDYASLRIIPSIIKMAVYARPDAEGDDIYETLLFA